MDEEIRFWDYSHANIEEARAKLQAAETAFEAANRRSEYLRNVIVRNGPTSGLSIRARAQLPSLAESAINRLRHIEYWKSVVA